MTSSIEWTNESWNVSTGCSHFGGGPKSLHECANCYAEKETKRLMQKPNITKYRKLKKEKLQSNKPR